MGQIRMKASRITSGLQLCGVVDANLDNAKQFGEQYQMPYAASVASFIHSEGAPDAIWISTPTDTHEALIEYAASLCIPVATEKPVAMDPTVTERLYTLCANANISLFCSFQRRADPHYMAMVERVSLGDIGHVQSMRSIFRDHPIPAIEFLVNGGDLFHDCGVHDIDFARFIMQCQDKSAEIKRVYATGHAFDKTLRTHNVLDLVNALLTFDNHAMYAMETSRTATYGYDQRFEVFGGQGTVKLDNVPETQYELLAANGVTRSCHQYSFPQRFDAAFQCEMIQFKQVINGELQPS
eukprot:CAMPEP_0202721254 /NCGR_PEP_ID=MMETSP1385-20130828/147365_1 /ASSEMBLY_ACC=CAM_ASM_000861 /TAXON_ID=933848 /ORGANISM="Elphidium margaritaceum" /LENGTH=295 /DNA_ID=CAMNT_0049385397 /DNA_START=104 /DNA_END=988 /DNA_ORIENTATION=-